jgi:hypothetical protein
MHRLLRSVLDLFNPEASITDSNADAPGGGSSKGPDGTQAEVAFRVPGMSWAVGWPTRVRRALATLPWVEQGTIQMEFKTRELRFGLNDTSEFNAQKVKNALKAQGFADAEFTSGP